jgi:hypothetical protein
MKSTLSSNKNFDTRFSTKCHVGVTTSKNENQENLFYSIKRLDSLPTLLDKIIHKTSK